MYVQFVMNENSKTSKLVKLVILHFDRVIYFVVFVAIYKLKLI